jgi:hypothetical protein
MPGSKEFLRAVNRPKKLAEATYKINDKFSRFTCWTGVSPVLAPVFLFRKKLVAGAFLRWPLEKNPRASQQ